jgi:hypothetical protein
MLWIIKMLLQTPRAVYDYRRDYYRHKQVRKVIKSQGLVAGFYKHDEMFGCDAEEWMGLCEYISDRGEEIPQGLIDFALDKGWIAYKPNTPDKNDGGPQESWREWENA